jgi:hypothetical protein
VARHARVPAELHFSRRTRPIVSSGRTDPALALSSGQMIGNGPCSAGSGFSVALCGNQNRRIAELSVDFSQREYDLAAIVGLGDQIARRVLAA